MTTTCSMPFAPPPGMVMFESTQAPFVQAQSRIRYHKKAFRDILQQMGQDALQHPPEFAESRSCVHDSDDDIATQWDTTCSLMQEKSAAKRTSPEPTSCMPAHSTTPFCMPAQGSQSLGVDPVQHAAAFAAAMAVLPSPVLAANAANGAALVMKALAQAGISAGAPKQRSYMPPVCSSGLASTTVPCMMPLAGYSSWPQHPAAANVNTRPASSSGGSSTPAHTSSWQDSSSGEQHPSMAPPSLTRVPPAAITAIMQPGNALWDEAVKWLLGFHDSTYAAAAWFVQAPHITGAMGPISAADMAAWLLQGAAPRQLSRPCHKPLLDMVAADRSQLLVCGVLAAEVQQVLMSGELAFMPLYVLLPALARGMEYSPVQNCLVYSAQQAATASTHGDTLQPGTPGTDCYTSPAPHCTDQTALPSYTMGQQHDALHAPASDSMTDEAAAEEISRIARSSPRERPLLVQRGFIPELVAVLQKPLQVATGQPHTAAAWALFHLLGRSKAAPQGCPAAQSAMAAVGAVKHLTTVLKAVRKSQGSGGGADPGAASPLPSSSTYSSTSAGSPQQEKAAAQLQEAVAAVLAGLATTPSGKEALLAEGTIPSLVRLLGSRFANVVDAAVGAVRNLSTPESYSVYKALFKAGVSTMLVHVVAHSTNPACKQNALKILLDLASAALDAPSAPSAPSTPTAESPAHAQADEYTASNAIDRLVQRSLPSVLIELLHKDTPPSLQARAMTVLLLLASQKPQEVLSSINCFDAATDGPSGQQSSCTGVQVLQKLICSSFITVQEGAMQLLHAMSDAGLLGKGHRRPH